MQRNTQGWWLVVAGALIALGSIRPWAAMPTLAGIRGSLDAFRLDLGQERVLASIAAVSLAAVGALLVRGRPASTPPKLIAWSAVVLTGLAWISAFTEIRDRTSEVADAYRPVMGDASIVGPEVSTAMWLVVVGCVTAVVGLILLSTPQPPPDHPDR